MDDQEKRAAKATACIVALIAVWFTGFWVSGIEEWALAAFAVLLMFIMVSGLVALVFFGMVLTIIEFDRLSSDKDK